MQDSSLAPDHSASRERAVCEAPKAPAAWCRGAGGRCCPSHLLGAWVPGTELRAVTPLPHVPPSASKSLSLSQSTPQIIINIINKNERQVIKYKICRVPPRTRRAVHKRDGLILLLIQAADETSPAPGLTEAVDEVEGREDHGQLPCCQPGTQREALGRDRAHSLHRVTAAVHTRDLELPEREPLCCIDNSAPPLRTQNAHLEPA